MQKPLSLLFLSSAIAAQAGDLHFQHHFANRDLPLAAGGVGDYGLTALVDLNRDGGLDFVVGGRSTSPSQLYWFEFQKKSEQWVKHLVGTNYLSDVGLTALDVDRDGNLDLVCSGVWYRNPGRPTEQPFERIVFDPAAAGAHDILAGDVDGDGRMDLIMMGDERTQLKELCWYSLPEDPRMPWVRHRIAAPVHGAITPAGAGDLDGDGDLDIVRADTWFENKNRGREWVAHQNIPMGRRGPFGICVRAAMVDLDGDGKSEVVVADADIEDSKVVVLKNADGKGGSWNSLPLPQTFKYGSLHSLAVADLNGDGRPDIVSNEQEELLPDGRQNPRWVVWENLGGLKFRETIVLDARLGGHELQVGDVDQDGDVDIVSKPWGVRPWNGAGGGMHVDFLENLGRTAK